ncbi:MAG: LTA synthase family protein [Candidatus Ventricola sp.]
MRRSDCAKARPARSATLLRGVCLALALVLNALCMLIFMEAIGSNSLSRAMIFVLERTKYAVCGTALILSLSAVLLFLLGRMAAALALNNAFFLCLSVVEYFKMQLRGEPFQPSDLALAGEALGVAGNMIGGSVSATPLMLLGIAVMLVGIPLLFVGIRVLRERPLPRVISLLASAAALTGCIFFAVGSPLMALEPEARVCIVDDDYRMRGFLIAFINRVQISGTNAVTRPKDYSPERVAAALDGHASESAEPQLKPNVLFLMSESLYDLSQTLALSEDPLAYFKQLQAEHWGGSFLSSVYGGGTVSSEYEPLTGYRIQDSGGLSFTAPGGVIQSGMLSVVSVLKSYGYYAQALHPGSRNFYSRSSAYDKLGFDSALFRADLDPVPENVFRYPSDEYMVDQLIKTYECRPEGQPWFCHAVTYQNHGGYDFESDFSQVRVEEDLPDKQLHSAQNYANMLKLSDEALRRLIAYFDAQEEPMVIVMWGDHAPSISQFGKTMPAGQESQMRHIYTTPLLIYSNFGLDTSCLPENISSYRLGAYVLRLLGMDCDPYFNYLSSEDAVNLTLFDGLIEQDGEWITDPQRYAEENDSLLLLHYDRLYGEKYGVNP